MSGVWNLEFGVSPILPALILCICLIASPAPADVDVTPPGEAAAEEMMELPLPLELPELHFPAWYDELDKARRQAFTGRYEMALQTLEASADAEATEAALVRAEALWPLGRHEEALAALADEAAAADPRAQVLRARILADSGETADAMAQLREHLQAHPDSIPGHFHLGQISEQAGDLATAVAAYGWFVEARRFLTRYSAHPHEFEDAEQVVLIGRAVDRWASLTAAYREDRSLHHTILGMFVRAYDLIDREYWPAHLAAAEYLLSHDDVPQARDDLAAALAGNPLNRRTLEVAGRVAVEQFNFDGADQAIAAMRRVNPQCHRADLLETRSLLQQRRPADARRPLDRVLKRQPRDVESLGLLAAVHALQLRDEQSAEVLRQIDQIAPGDARGYHEVAEQLAAMRQYPRSAAMYQEAIERAPWWTAPRNGLGLLYTQSGDEELAHRVLDAAHALDPFNLRTTNYLRLLDDMMGFARHETENFIILYDAEQDPIIPEFFAEYLESIYDEICDFYNHRPGRKTLIEVFPTHDGFSVRTTGSPWIGTVGASTGPVIAMVAPRRGRNTMGPFNWAEVLRHEFIHTVTLSATENRISHWMTEGLAVMGETEPLKWEWVPMLYHAVMNDELFTMQNLTWGFVRPRRPIDRSLAYAQSYWVCSYIKQTYGQEALLEMMDAFRRGLRQEEVFVEVLKRSESQFTEEFFAWTRQQIEGWGYDEETSAKYDELRQEAESLVRGRRYEEAVPVWEQIVAIRPVDALPHQRLAGLYLTPQVNRPEKAVEHLTTLHRAELKDNRYAKRIARVYRGMDRPEEAAQFALEAVYIDPYDLDAHRLLAELYEQTGNQAGLERQQRVTPVVEEWTASQRRRGLLPGAPEP